jgi:serine/threonine-protein kinase
MPEPRRPWALYGAAVTAILVGVVAVIVAVRTVTNARSQPPPLPAVSTEPVPAPPPSPVITAPPEPTPAPAPQVPKKIAVGLAATPEAAVGIRDGKIMKLPATIELAEGQVVSVDIRAEGYEAQTVKLDGKEQIRMVKLNKLPSSLGPKTGPTGTAKELVNPFDPRYRDRPR